MPLQRAGHAPCWSSRWRRPAPCRWGDHRERHQDNFVAIELPPIPTAVLADEGATAICVGETGARIGRAERHGSSAHSPEQLPSRPGPDAAGVPADRGAGRNSCKASHKSRRPAPRSDNPAPNRDRAHPHRKLTSNWLLKQRSASPRLRRSRRPGLPRNGDADPSRAGARHECGRARPILSFHIHASTVHS